MWQVLRQRQSLEYEHSAPTRGCLADNMRHITRFERKANPKPLDPHLLTEPYEVRVYDKLVRNLASPDLVLRQKAVQALIHYFDQQDQHISRTLECGGLEALVVALNDTDEWVRIHACIALARVARYPEGQQAILDKNFVEKLMEPVHDSSAVAVEALRILAAMDGHWNDRACTAALIQAGSVGLYIDRIQKGPDDVKLEALKALNKVYNVKEAFIGVLDHDAVAVLTALINDPDCSPDVHTQAAENICALAFYSAGKRAACRDPKTVQGLLSLLKKGDTTDVRVAASGALMAITIDNRGKELCLENSGCEIFMQCIEVDTDDALLTNVAKTLCNVGENPLARKKLSKCIPTLQTIADNCAERSPSLANSALRAIEMITWTP